MLDTLLKNSPTSDFLNKLSGLDEPGGNERVKRIVHRVIADIFETIED